MNNIFLCQVIAMPFRIFIWRVENNLPVNTTLVVDIDNDNNTVHEVLNEIAARHNLNIPDDLSVKIYDLGADEDNKHDVMERKNEILQDILGAEDEGALVRIADYNLDQRRRVVIEMGAELVMPLNPVGGGRRKKRYNLRKSKGRSKKRISKRRSKRS